MYSNVGNFVIGKIATHTLNWFSIQSGGKPACKILRLGTSADIINQSDLVVCLCSPFYSATGPYFYCKIMIKRILSTPFGSLYLSKSVEMCLNAEFRPSYGWLDSSALIYPIVSTWFLHPVKRIKCSFVARWILVNLRLMPITWWRQVSTVSLVSAIIVLSLF